MKIKNILSYSLLLLLGLVAWSCSDSDNARSAKQMKLFQDDKEVTELNFSLGAASQMVGVFSDAAWEAKLDVEDWCTITPHAGFVDGDSIQYIKVTVTKNDGEARSALLTVKAGNTVRTLTINQSGMGTDPNDPFESSFAFVENLKYGYNLGNTLDATNDVEGYTQANILDYETIWSQPVTTQAIIDAIAAKGFNIIRVPVTWWPHMDAEGNVDEAWMNRVEEVVKYVLNAGCYCILNVQHDTGAKDASATGGGAWITTDKDEYEAGTGARFKKLWTQIATRFKDYNDKLLFEAMNETLNKDRSWSTGYADYSEDDYATLNNLIQDFVDAVRATGGNNEYRNLVFAPVGSTNTQVALTHLTCPNDVHANHLVGSIHTYDPYWFCNDTNNRDDRIYYLSTFDKDCMDTIDDIFARVEAHYRGKLGVPYIYGEFGAIGTHPDMAERVKYAQYMKSKFKEYSTSGLWWMGLYNRKTGEWYEEDIVNALFE